MEDNTKNSNSDGNLPQGKKLEGRPGWVSAIEVFSEISTWIIVPIVLALFVGKYLDTRFGTKPVIFFCLTALGFIITCYGIYIAVKNYTNKLKEEDKRMKDNAKEN